MEPQILKKRKWQKSVKILEESQDPDYNPEEEEKWEMDDDEDLTNPIIEFHPDTDDDKKDQWTRIPLRWKNRTDSGVKYYWWVYWPENPEKCAVFEAKLAKRLAKEDMRHESKV